MIDIGNNDDVQKTKEAYSDKIYIKSDVLKQAEELIRLDTYPNLFKYTEPVKIPEREIIGRKDEMLVMLAAFKRPELSNVLLLAEAGSGKTALVQGCMTQDTDRLYLEVELSRMIADIKTDANEMADMLKTVFDEVEKYVRVEGHEVILFIDEFHQIVQLSSAAVEALKPLLADSGTRGIRVIAATTYVEFRTHISPNQPLVERLQRINLTQPGKEMVIEILKGMAIRYGVNHLFASSHIYEMIYEYTNRYIPANSQPRKSILILDSMVGWHRLAGREMDMNLLSDVIYQAEGVNVAFRVDALSIKTHLDKYVYAQDFATSVIEQRLQICVADLNNKNKPMSSFLFTGSTGVGKSLLNSENIPVYDNTGEVFFKKNEDLNIGDYVFNKVGKPVRVKGVFPQGKLPVCEVALTDGRKIKCSHEHIWTYKSEKDECWKNATTRELMNKNEDISIPVNYAVQWPESIQAVDSYVIGAFLGKGSLREPLLTISAGDHFHANKICDLLGAASADLIKSRYSYVFMRKNIVSLRRKRVHTDEVFSEIPELLGCYSREFFIPEKYKYGSISQRWGLIQGLFDTSAFVRRNKQYDYDIILRVKSKQLCLDAQHILYSLGIVSTLDDPYKDIRHKAPNSDYCLYVTPMSHDIKKLFTSPLKVKEVNTLIKPEIKDFVRIEDIVELNYQEEMTCISVDDDEQLYQAGNFIVTHNTEVVKRLADILFEDDRNLIRFDMTEYANEDSLERFREELTTKVWERPYSIVLLDEIEKACAPVTRILLQVLDDAKLTDINNREISFTNCYIVLTTNAGSEIYENISQYSSDDEGSGDVMKRYNKLIRDSISGTTGDNRFPPELLGRIDMIVPFQPLSEATLEKIVKNQLIKLQENVRKKHNVDLKLHKDLIRYLVQDNYDTETTSGGARGVISKLEQEVTTAVARFINTYPNVPVIGATIEGDMAIDNKEQLESRAYVKIVTIV